MLCYVSKRVNHATDYFFTNYVNVKGIWRVSQEGHNVKSTGAGDHAGYDKIR